MRLDINKIKYFIIFGLLFLMSMNFYAKYFYFVFIVFILLFLMQKKVVFNKTVIIYLLFSLLTSIYRSSDGLMPLIRCMSYVALYMVGYNLMFDSFKENNMYPKYSASRTEKLGYTLLVIIACGTFLHYLINFGANYDYVERNAIDIWTGEDMAATIHAALSIIMIGLTMSLVLLSPKKIFKILGLLCICLILAYNLILACRSTVVIIIVTFLVALIYTLITCKSSKIRLKIGIEVLMVTLIVALVILLDIGGIQGYIADSNIISRFDFSNIASIIDSERTTAKISYLTNVFNYPFGGLNLREQYGYAHDLLLDGFDEYGFAGLILIVMILVSGIKELVILIKHTKYSKVYKCAILCIYICILLEFFVEPILAGVQWLFPIFCLINGSIMGMNKIHLYERSIDSSEIITN